MVLLPHQFTSSIIRIICHLSGASSVLKLQKQQWHFTALQVLLCVVTDTEVWPAIVFQQHFDLKHKKHKKPQSCLPYSFLCWADTKCREKKEVTRAGQSIIFIQQMLQIFLNIIKTRLIKLQQPWNCVIKPQNKNQYFCWKGGNEIYRVAWKVVCMNHNIIMCTTLLLPILKVNKLGSVFYPIT